ncbi:uncharacterized protein Dwil_GK11638 [Drosophila willistoni]|uniref:Uncharacterized protein n=1 Tax=Drosophila willistoni TaxID=7260 RepID=B4N468_DROWI|nr:uncharacterized protein LOC6645271 [Drosophila willistoni]EDW78942.1 uncharacterized protein Dwil_GK11638 [Drosophila willistoni]
MQFHQQPQSMQWKIAILIIALAGNVLCIRNGKPDEGPDEAGDSNIGNDEIQNQRHISVKLKNFFPSEPLKEDTSTEAQHPPQIEARVTTNGGGGAGGFRPSQMLDFTPSDVMSDGYNTKRYPPSYLAPNYKHQVPSSLPNYSLRPQPIAMDKQFAFPNDNNDNESPNRGVSSGFNPYGGYHQNFASTPIPTTPVVSYLDPYTQQNYQYTPTPPIPPAANYIQYQREQIQNNDQNDDQIYTVQSSLLVGNNNNHGSSLQRPPLHGSGAGGSEDVYLKRPGYVFDESPSTVYRRPAVTPSSFGNQVAQPTKPSHKISYDSHDYPPPSYAAEQTSNFVPQRPVQRPLYNRQDVNDNRPLAAASSIQLPYAGAGASLSSSAYAQSSSYPSPASLPPSSSSNYANNFGNYLQRPNPNPQPAHHYQQQQQQQRPGPPPHNYYEYQIGEIPPPHHSSPSGAQQFNYRPSSPPYQQHSVSPSTQNSGIGGGSLATLASLFSSTQQYAPQFTNLLLGGSPTSSSYPTSSQHSSPLGSLLGAFAGQGQGQGQGQHARPPNTQLIRALENIARNDDLQCVPKVLCQMIAGQTLRGQLPGFITSPAITNFLAGFPTASPALIYGRAALLGISGGERSCVQTYQKCPKNEMEIIHYLNNHRGGFFKFFSEPEEQPSASQQGDFGGGNSGSLFSILSALTGGGGGGQSTTYTTPRPVAPKPKPTQKPSTDIASGIGSFFTQVLSEYLSGVEYQRRRRRRSPEIKRDFQTDFSHSQLMANDDFHDEEDNLDTQTIVKFQDDDEAEEAQAHTELIGVLQFPSTLEENEGRILHYKDIDSEEDEKNQGGVKAKGIVRFPDALREGKQVINEFNREAAQRKLRFPHEEESVKETKRVEDNLTEGWRAVLPNGLSESDYGVSKRRGKRIVFRDSNDNESDNLREEEQRELKLREEEQQFREERQLREEQQIRELEFLRVEHLRREKEKQLSEELLTHNYPPNAVYEESAPPQRGARVIFPDHYERYIRKGKILNRPTYAPSYEYLQQNAYEVDQKEDRLVVSDEHRPSSHYRFETSDNLNQNHLLNYGEYMPPSGTSSGGNNNIRFGEQHYNYPNNNYISNNRYSSAYQQTNHEDDKNIYVTNSQGINEYYIRPNGQKVYTNSG